MSKNLYKQRISDFIDELIAEGVDQHQLVNDLTHCTLSLIEKTQDKPDKASE